MGKVIGVLLFLLPAVFGNGIFRFEAEESRDVAVPEIEEDVLDAAVATSDAEEDGDSMDRRTRCPYGFTRFGSSCFHGSAFTANWMDASVYCAAYDSHLAVLDTSYKQSIVSRVIKQEYQHYAKSGFWIGGTDVLWNHHWVWYGGNKMTYANWYPGRPKNYGNCVYMTNRAFKWYDYNCASGRYFICETKAKGGGPVVE